jgi:LPXTG-motif cell wall-anchored protein
MLRYLNLLFFLAGLASLLYGYSCHPHITWMIWAGATLVLIAGGIYIRMRRNAGGGHRSSGRGSGRSGRSGTLR